MRQSQPAPSAHRSPTAAHGTGAGIGRNRPPSGISSPLVSARRTLPSPLPSPRGGLDPLRSVIGSQLGRESLADRLGATSGSPKANHSHNASAQSSPAFSGGGSSGSVPVSVNSADALPPVRCVEPPPAEIRTTGGGATSTPALWRGNACSASSTEASELRRSRSTGGSILWETASALSRAASPVMEVRSPRLPPATTTTAPGAGGGLAVSASRLLLSGIGGEGEDMSETVLASLAELETRLRETSRASAREVCSEVRRSSEMQVENRLDAFSGALDDLRGDFQRLMDLVFAELRVLVREVKSTSLAEDTGGVADKFRDELNAAGPPAAVAELATGASHVDGNSDVVVQCARQGSSLNLVQLRTAIEACERGELRCSTTDSCSTSNSTAASTRQVMSSLLENAAEEHLARLDEVLEREALQRQEGERRLQRQIDNLQRRLRAAAAGPEVSTAGAALGPQSGVGTAAAAAAAEEWRHDLRLHFEGAAKELLEQYDNELRKARQAYECRLAAFEQAMHQQASAVGSALRRAAERCGQEAATVGAARAAWGQESVPDSTSLPGACCSGSGGGGSGSLAPPLTAATRAMAAAADPLAQLGGGSGLGQARWWKRG